MKFELISDLHLTQNTIFYDDFFDAKSEILVLAGDICEYHEIPKYYEFFEKISKNWKTILYVLGNHEFYFGQIDKVANIIRNHLKELKNIIILDNESVNINNIQFVGSTLWASMFNGYHVCMNECELRINDFKCISSKYPSIKLDGIEILTLFYDHSRFIRNLVDNSLADKIVVITHFAPSLQSIHPRFAIDTLRGYFASDIEDIIEYNNKVKVWCHGHTHDNFDYMINQCRVVCNPLGYENKPYYPQLINV